MGEYDIQAQDAEPGVLQSAFMPRIHFNFSGETSASTNGPNPFEFFFLDSWKCVVETLPVSL